MIGRIATSLVCLLCLSCICTANPALAVELAPVQVVRNLQKAVDEADVALLDQSADVEAVLGQAVDVLLKDYQTAEAQASLPPMIAMLLSSVASNASLRGLLQNEAAAFVRYGVRSGHFAGEPRDNAKDGFRDNVTGMLAPLFADASLGRKEVRNITPMASQGDVAVVAFEVLDHGNGQTYPVQAELRRAQGRWRIVGLPNMPQLLRQVREESKP